MKINLLDNGYLQHKRVMLNSICERIPVEFTKDGLTIVFGIDNRIGVAESYQIEHVDSVWYITGSDVLGLFFGIGKF